LPYTTLFRSRHVLGQRQGLHRMAFLNGVQPGDEVALQLVSGAGCGPAPSGRLSAGAGAGGRAAVRPAAVRRATVRRATVRMAAVRRASIRRATVRMAAVRRASIRRATVRRAAVGRATAQRAAVRRAAVRTGGVPAPGLILFRIVVLPAPRKPCHALHPPVTDVSIALFQEFAAGRPSPAPAGRKPTKLLMLRTFSSFFLGPFAGAGRKDAGRANGDGKLPGPPSPCLRGRSCHIFAFLSLGRYIRVPNNMGGTDAHFRVSRNKTLRENSMRASGGGVGAGGVTTEWIRLGMWPWTRSACS